MTGQRHDGAPTPQAIFDGLPARFLPEVAGRTKATVQVELTGDGGGRWWVRVADGRCTAGAGTVDKPDVTLTADASDYVKIRLGQLDPITATVSGQMKVTGNYGMAIKFSTMFRPGA
jgi:putative sterol carrier protein